MWLGFFLLYLRQNIKHYTSNGLRLSWKILPKKKIARASIDRVNSQPIEPDRFTR